jgi:hypothetical protein
MRATGVTALAAMALLLAACATARGGSVGGEGGEAISYATAPCFGTCPVYRVTVRPDGTGTFVGERFTAVTGERAIVVPRDAYRRFAAVLAPYRPARERLVEPGSADCADAPTDMPSVDVRWRGAGGERHLRFYKGCRRSNTALAAALDQAPAMLPIGALVGK